MKHSTFLATFGNKDQVPADGYCHFTLWKMEEICSFFRTNVKFLVKRLSIVECSKRVVVQ